MNLQTIQNKIYEIRDQKVMLDFDLAELYETETRVLKQAVRRNIERFPEDFMFELSDKEFQALRSQIVMTSSDVDLASGSGSGWGGSRYRPFTFTEQGVAMLSSVLKNKKAVEVNINIMRAFVFLRQYALTHKDITGKLKELESKYDRQFKDVYEAINYLLEKDKQEIDQKERKRIGFNREKK